MVETIRDWRHEENGDEVHLLQLARFTQQDPDTYNPDGCGKQTELNARQAWVDAAYDNSRVSLCSVAYSHHTKVHDDKGVNSPVDYDVPEILHIPQLAAVDAGQIFVMDARVFAF